MVDLVVHIDKERQKRRGENYNIRADTTRRPPDGFRFALARFIASTRLMMGGDDLENTLIEG